MACSLPGVQPRRVAGQPSFFSTNTDVAHYARYLLRAEFTPDNDHFSVRLLRDVEPDRTAAESNRSKTLNGYGLCFGVGDADGWTCLAMAGAV